MMYSNARLDFVDDENGSQVPQAECVCCCDPAERISGLCQVLSAVQSDQGSGRFQALLERNL
jgi:hypothetical protein